MMTRVAPPTSVALTPIVGWPREAAPGGRYLVSVDLQLNIDAAAWPYPDEEYTVGLMLSGRSHLTVTTLGDMSVVVHRFGGTYGPARFVVGVDNAVANGIETALWLTLISAGGVPFHTAELPITVTHDAPVRSAATGVSLVRSTAQEGELAQLAGQMFPHLKPGQGMSADDDEADIREQARPHHSATPIPTMAERDMDIFNVAVSSETVEPVERPAGLGREATYCPQCPGWYRLSDITAISQDGTVTSANRVLLKVTPTVRSRLFGGRRKVPELTQAQRADIVAKNYKMECPRSHTLISMLEPTVVVGVIGNVNSSKSHYLAGLIYELIFEERLARLDADVAYIGDTGRAMDERIGEVYQRGRVLPNTERGRVSGPFSYRLTRHARTSIESRSVLTFFDVAGEDCVGLSNQADFVRYLFDAIGTVVLIDPAGLPFRGRPLSPRSNVSLVTRAIIDNLADTLEAVTGKPAREHDQIICIAIAKADSAELPTQVWPPAFWLSSSEEHIRQSDLLKSLKQYSNQCRQALALLGGQGIISAAETRFLPDHVFYSAVSATNQMPLDGRWVQAQPIGCSIPLAQILSFGNAE